MTAVRLNDTTLTILRQSASTPGLVHATSIDLVTGACSCSDTCPARHKAHKHTAELRAVKAALAAFCATTGMSRYEAALSLSRTLKVQNGMSEEFLQQQCGQHPDGGAPWAAPDTLAHQAARLILADRVARESAERKGARKVAA